MSDGFAVDEFPGPPSITSIFPGDDIFLSLISDEKLIYNEPQPGDTAYIFIEKPFLTEDIYEFTTIAPYIDQQKAITDLDKIKVVPNPYYATNTFEGQNTFTSGRGPREIQFRFLPQECKIRIYTISGELVKEIHHQSSIDYGTGKWDLLTKDNLTKNQF